MRTCPTLPNAVQFQLQTYGVLWVRWHDTGPPVHPSTVTAQKMDCSALLFILAGKLQRAIVRTVGIMGHIAAFVNLARKSAALTGNLATDQARGLRIEDFREKRKDGTHIGRLRRTP